MNKVKPTGNKLTFKVYIRQLVSLIIACSFLPVFPAGAKFYVTPRIDPAEGNITRDIAEGRWSKDNPSSDKPGVGGTINNANVYPSTYWHRDASFLRLKNVELGANFSAKWLGRDATGINNLRVYIGGYNLLTFEYYHHFHTSIR